MGSCSGISEVMMQYWTPVMQYWTPATQVPQTCVWKVLSSSNSKPGCSPMQTVGSQPHLLDWTCASQGLNHLIQHFDWVWWLVEEDHRLQEAAEVPGLPRGTSCTMTGNISIGHIGLDTE